MRTRRTVTTGLVLAFVLAPCRPASANGEESAAFDGNASAPDQRGALEQVQIQGTQTENVQTRPSSWRVGPAGDARWSEELNVVPGINGLQPSLSVEYNSQSDNGLIGQGFSLVGLPAIVRVHGTDNGVTADSEPRGVQFDDHDSFAMAPGGWGTPVSMRGRLVAGGNGAGTFHTAVESWDQFTPYGNCGDASFAPCAWVGEDGQGNTYYYGASADGRLWERPSGQDQSGVPIVTRGVMAWALTHVQDKHGNLYEVKYFSDGFMLYPERIEYGCPLFVDPGTPSEEQPPADDWPMEPMDPVTGFDPGVPVGNTEMTTNEILGTTGPFVGLAQNPPASSTTVTVNVGGDPPPTCTGRRTVQFEYETRADITSMPGRYSNRLRSVEMTAGGQHVRGYRFEYENELSPSWGRSRLHQFLRVGSDQFTEDEPITFAWSDGKMLSDVQEDRSWSVDGAEPVSTLVADVNGDGLSDLIRVSLGEDRRQVTWALGEREAGEEGQAPLGPISGPLTTDGDYEKWSATVGDIDADGRDDLILWKLHNSDGEVQFHRGTPTGLGPMEKYADNSAVKDFAQFGGRPKTHYRLFVADINGDQIDDMLLVNRYKGDSRRVAYALGSPAGFGDLEYVVAGSLLVGGDPASLEPIVHDINGDGIDDLIISYSRVSGITSQIFVGRSDGLQHARVLAWGQSVSSAACPGTCGGDPQCVCNGVTPFQTLRTDVNGDGIGDITLAYTGAAVAMDEQVPKPFGRNVTSWLGQGNFSTLPDPDADGRVADEAVHQLLDPASYPGIDGAAPNRGHWEHHSGDVNGDGFSDVVAFYAGVEGLRAAYSFGTPTGQLGPMTSITDCAASSEDGSWEDSCDPLPDGDYDVHRWHSLLLDIDGDGRSDLLRYYAGDEGRIVEVAKGGPAGLTGFKSFLSDSPVPESTIMDLANASSVRLMTADFNGDGARDLVLATQDAVVLKPARPAPDQSDEGPDLLVAVDDGYAGTVEFEYEMAARLTGAIDPDASSCGNASGEDCGTPNRSARPLATRVVQHDGRGGDYAVHYSYANGRYYPGPVVVNSMGTRPHARADLAFEWVESTDEQTGVRTRTHYYQDPDRKRLPQKEDQFAPHYPFSGSPFSMLVRRKTFEYERSSTPFNTQKVELVADSEQTFEWGINGPGVSREYDYGQYGGQVRVVECADSICMETESLYEDPVITSGSYRLQRLLETKSHRQGEWDDRVISWARHTYDGDLLRSVEQLLCDDSEKCWCYADADACISIGTGEWIATQDDLQYDSFGNVVSERDAAGSQTRVEFDAQYHTYPAATESEVEDATGVLQTRRTEKTYDDAGRVLTSTDLNGNVSGQTYDAIGRPRTATHPNGLAESWDYENLGDPDAQLVRHTELVDVDTGATRFREEYFDGLGRTHKTRASAGADVSVVRTEETFEDNHRVVMKSDPRLESEVGATLWTEVRFDPRGRQVEINRIEGGAGQGAYLGTLSRRTYGPTAFSEESNHAPVDDDGRLLGNDWVLSTHTFDSRGNPLAIQQGGSRTDYAYDHALRLHTVWGPHAWNSTAPMTSEQFVLYTYDTFGQVRLASDTEGYTTFDYDAVGNLTETNDANGDNNSYTHDAWGRMLSRKSTSGTESFLYDQFPNGIGHQTTVVGPWGSEVLSGGFDAVGNPLGRDITLVGLSQTQTESYEYRADGSLVRKTLPDATLIDYGYRNSGDLTTVHKNGVLYLELDQFDANGNPGLRITPASMTSYVYNASGRLLTLVAESAMGGEPLLDYAYSYDAPGNVLGIVDQRVPTKVGSIETSDTWSFVYDQFSQLETASDFEGTKTHYSYDAATRITSKGGRAYTYDGQIIDIDDDGKITQLKHDDMGRLKSKVGPAVDWKYTHDSLGRLLSTHRDSKLIASMDYNASGQRVRKVENVGGEFVTTWYVSPNYELRQDSRAPGNVVPTVIVDGGGNGVVATETVEELIDAPNADAVSAAWGYALNVGHAGGAPVGVHFHHHNHIGSTSVITDASGKAVSIYRNTPWGERKDGGTGFDVAFREFTGQVRDEQSELLYYGARYYDPDVGRFLEPDTDDLGMPFFPDAESMNRHTYVKNNPVRYTDPTGHNPLDPKDVFVKESRQDLQRMNKLPTFEPYDSSIDDALLKERPTRLGWLGNWLKDHSKFRAKVTVFDVAFTFGEDEDGGIPDLYKVSTPTVDVPLPRGLNVSANGSAKRNGKPELKVGLGIKKKRQIATLRAQAYVKASTDGTKIVAKPGAETSVSVDVSKHVFTFAASFAIEGDEVPVLDAADYLPIR